MNKFFTGAWLFLAGQCFAAVCEDISANDAKRCAIDLVISIGCLAWGSYRLSKLGGKS